MKRLSEELGEQLVTIEHGVVRPTDYGQLVLDLSNDVERSLADFRRAFEALRFHKNRLIKIGFTVGSLGYFGEGYFDQLNESQQDEDCAVHTFVDSEIPEEQLQESLLTGNHDFGVLLNVTSGDLMRIHLVSDFSFIWVRHDDPLANKNMIDLDDLDGRTVYAFDYDANGYGPMLQSLTSQHVRLDLRFIGEMMRVFEYAYSGKAVGLTTRQHVEAVQGTGVVGVPFARLPVDYYLCYQRDRALSDGDRRLIDYMCRRKKMHREQKIQPDER